VKILSRIDQEQVIEVEHKAPGIALLNQQEVRFDVQRISEKEFSLLYNQRSYYIQVLKNDPGSKKMLISVNGKKCSVELEDEYDSLLKKLGMDTAGGKQVKELKAPMPGLVVDVLVNEGDLILKDQPLVILEAMKMENILKAQADVTIGSIHVKKGAAVEKNQVLIKYK
jgi:biotin carboxyl carrier protein